MNSVMKHAMRVNGGRRGPARLRGAVGCLLLLAVSVLPAGAQTVVPQQGRAGQRREQGERAVMERRLQERIDNVIRTRLALTDEQFRQLRVVSSRTENDRRALRREEMTVRTELRKQLLAGEAVSEARVAELLDQMPRLERRRIELMEQEQRELAKFLQPSQRARYYAVQDEMRRTLQEGQRRRAGGEGGPGENGGRSGPPRDGAGAPRRGIRPPLPPAE